MDPTSELLSQLEALQLPTEPGMGVAPGWFGLLLLAVLVLGFLYWRYSRKKPVTKLDWRPEAREELARISASLEHATCTEVLVDCSRFARRVALAARPRRDIAALQGEHWLRTLDELSQTGLFTAGPGRALLSGPYQAPTDTVSAQSLQPLLDALNTLLGQCETSLPTKASSLTAAGSTAEPVA